MSHERGRTRHAQRRKSIPFERLLIATLLLGSCMKYPEAESQPDQISRAAADAKLALTKCSRLEARVAKVEDYIARAAQVGR